MANGKASKRQKLIVLVKQRISDLEEEIVNQKEKRGSKVLIQKLEEALAQNEVILMKLEGKEIVYH